MASPSSQQIALWVADSLDETDWVLLSSVCLRALTGQLHGWHENDLIDLVEEHLAHIAEHLRDRAAHSRVDGEVLTFEIDDEPAPYVRGLNPENRQLLAKLRGMHPGEFENICARILQGWVPKRNRLGRHTMAVWIFSDIILQPCKKVCRCLWYLRRL